MRISGAMDRYEGVNSINTTGQIIPSRLGTFALIRAIMLALSHVCSKGDKGKPR